jgi:outer membrane lipoprotein-sorting protein
MKKIVITFLFFFFSTNVFAAENLNKETVKKVEDYINGIKYLSSSFIQSSSDGEVAEGKFYLSRPEKIRIEYKPPQHVLIVANGGALMYYDKELDEVSYIKTSSTPLYVLAKKNFSLNDEEIKITRLEEKEKTISVSATKREEESIGQITFVFDKNPTTLTKIETVDEFGNSTEVFLYDIDYKTELNKELFKTANPRLQK